MGVAGEFAISFHPLRGDTADRAGSEGAGPALTFLLPLLFGMRTSPADGPAWTQNSEARAVRVPGSPPPRAAVRHGHRQAPWPAGTRQGVAVGSLAGD